MTSYTFGQEIEVKSSTKKWYSYGYIVTGSCVKKSFDDWKDVEYDPDTDSFAEEVAK